MTEGSSEGDTESYCALPRNRTMGIHHGNDDADTEQASDSEEDLEFHVQGVFETNINNPAQSEWVNLDKISSPSDRKVASVPRRRNPKMARRGMISSTDGVQWKRIGGRMIKMSVQTPAKRRNGL